MSHKVNSTYVGAFAFGGLFLLIVLLLVLSKGSWFSTTLQYSLFLDTSVRGLSEGAPVMFRGVKIGTVSDIRLAYRNTDKNDLSKSNWPIEVIVQIDPEVIVSRQNDTLKDQLKKQFFGTLLWKKQATESLMDSLVLEQGLQAQLKNLSIVTGKLYIELNFFPVKKGAELENVRRNLERGILPTHLSVFEKMFLQVANKNLDDYMANFYLVMDQLSAFVQSGKFRRMLDDSATLVSDTKNTMHTSQITVGILSSQISGAVDRLNSLLNNAEKEMLALSTDCRKQLKELTDEVKQTSGRIGRAADASTGLMNSVQGEIRQNKDQFRLMVEKILHTTELLEQNLAESRSLIGSLQEDAPMQKDIRDALQEMEKAAAALKNMAELLQNRPDVLLRGK